MLVVHVVTSEVVVWLELCCYLENLASCWLEVVKIVLAVHLL